MKLTDFQTGVRYMVRTAGVELWSARRGRAGLSAWLMLARVLLPSWASAAARQRAPCTPSVACCCCPHHAPLLVPISLFASLQEFTEAVTRSYKSGQAVSLPLLD